MAYADERHDALLRKLAEVAAKRQAAANEEARRADRAGDVEQRDWLGTGAQGASLGSSFGPWGALVGGIIGSGYGMIRAGRNRMQHGQNFFEAAGNTMGDFLPENVRKHPGEFGQKALPALGMLGKAYQQNQANKALSGVQSDAKMGDLGSGNATPSLTLQKEFSDPNAEALRNYRSAMSSTPQYGGLGGQKLAMGDNPGVDNGQAWEIGPDGKIRFKLT